MVWNPINNPYKCVVASPKKESKLKGLKSFIAYQLTPTVSIVNIAQSRYIFSQLLFCHFLPLLCLVCGWSAECALLCDTVVLRSSQNNDLLFVQQ